MIRRPLSQIQDHSLRGECLLTFCLHTCILTTKAISYIRRKDIHSPCSVVVNSLDYVISKYLFCQSHSKLVLQCWGTWQIIS